VLLFAMRNATQPVRFRWTGAQLHSNCARSRQELAVLAEHGEKIKVLELESELFFGVVSALDKQLHASLEAAQTVVLDWSRVRNVDSSIAVLLRRWLHLAETAQVQILHAGLGLQNDHAAQFLAQYLPAARLLPDVDRALELAENNLISIYGQKASNQTTVLQDALLLFRGLTHEQRELVEACMTSRLFKSGDVIFQVGDASDCMVVVQHGSAGVIVRQENGHDLRLTSVRRGGVLGEVGFLDGAQRSATVVAQEDLLVLELSRSAFENLRSAQPDIVYLIMRNLTVDLAMRLRNTTKLAAARQSAT
jgi:sulfate permease, SulP family